MPKKMSSMKPEELAAEAGRSPADAARIAQYVFSTGCTSSALQTWELMSKDSKTSSIPDVAVFMLRAIGERQPSPKAWPPTKEYLVLVNLLEGRPPVEDAPGRYSNTLADLYRKYRDSDYAPIMMLTSGTPSCVTNSIAGEYGMHAKADAVQAEARKKLMFRFDMLSSVIRWGNEQSGVLMGSLLMSNPRHPDAMSMVAHSKSFPSTFVHAVFEIGHDDLKKKVAAEMGDTASLADAKNWISKVKDGETEQTIANSVMNSKVLTPAQKADFARMCADPANKKTVLFRHLLLNHIYKSTDSELYEVGVEDYERGDHPYLRELEANIPMSLEFADRIIAVAKKIGQMDWLSQSLKVYIALSGEEEF